MAETQAKLTQSAFVIGYWARIRNLSRNATELAFDGRFQFDDMDEFQRGWDVADREAISEKLDQLEADLAEAST